MTPQEKKELMFILKLSFKVVIYLAIFTVLLITIAKLTGA